MSNIDTPLTTPSIVGPCAALLVPVDFSAASARASRMAVSLAQKWGARVTFVADHVGPGWNAPEFAPWLDDALQRASLATFGQPARAYGEGGTIPFMGMLGDRFPAAQFVITGVLGPGSNAHGPNEFLDLSTARRVTEVLAVVIQAHATKDATIPD